MIRFGQFTRTALPVLFTAAMVACKTSPSEMTTVVAVDQVMLDQTSLNLLVGAQQTLTATPMGKGAALTGHTVTWTSGNTAVATVASGKVTGVSAGNTVITATSDGIDATATVAVANPAPTFSLMAPVTAVATSSAFTLTVTGTGFVATTTVQWNGSARVTTFVSSTQLHVAILASDVAAVGTAQVTVVNLAPGGGVSSALPFTITGTAPAITTLSPILALAGGSAFTVTVTGSNFTSGSVVQWNGQARTTTFVSSTQLTAQVLASDIAVASTGQVTVQAPAGVSAAKPLATVGPTQTVGAGCAISATNALYCWGDNRYGGVGDGSVTQVDLAPVHIAGGLTFSSVSVGYDATCGLTTGGDMYCWGPNDGFANSAISSNSVVPVHVAPGLTFASVSRNTNDVCGITTDGHTYCWGTNTYGEDGEGSTTAHASPVQVSGGQTFVEVSVGTYQTCGLVASGAAYCWGHNESGELGNASTTDSHAPVAVAGGHSFVAISAGNPSCALDRSGTAWCWGDNSGGTLGNGSTVNSAVPVAVMNSLPFTAISVFSSSSYSYACGITTLGTASCWGSNPYGQLGSGTDASSLIPMPVAGGLTFSALGTGIGNVCGITTSGNAVCWGVRSFGDLGNGTIGFRNVPTAMVGGLSFTKLSIGEKHACGLVAAGDVYCWGDGSVGQLGNGANVGSPSPVKVLGGHHFVALGTTSGRVTCAIASDPLPPTHGTYCWGSNLVGELGTGTLEASDNVPVLVTGSLTFQSISSSDDASAQGYSTTCGVTTSGSAYCWGYNGAGQLGNGASTASPNPSPVAVTGGHVFSSITPGGDHTCGVDTAGAAWCWGDDQLGELGLGRLGNGTQVTPQAVVPATFGAVTYLSLVAAFGKTCGVTTVPGYVECWGWRTPTGGGPATLSTPFQLQGYSSIQIAGTASCALDSAGIVTCWDHNENGEMGIGTFQVVPGWQYYTDIPTLRFQSIYSGGNAMCALMASGAAYCWGSNNYGLLGVGETDHVNQPTPVSGGISFLAPHIVMAGGIRTVPR